MSNFNEQNFEKKLQGLKDSQESIQTLSAWCLHHRQHHKKIVACWLRILKRVKIDHRLTLFYLANDVIQYSKRKNYEFVESWGTALQRATTMVRDEKIIHRVLRIFKIWDERGIYDEAFIADLSGLLSSSKKNVESTDPADFQPTGLISKIQQCQKLEDDTDGKLRKINESAVSLSDIDALRSHLKDRRHGDDAVAEVEEGIGKVEAYVKALEVEVKERRRLIEHLGQGQTFYNTQRGEAKIVANAYRNFGARVKNLKKRLDDLTPTLESTSPIPSPDINAPSPSPDSDIELPGDDPNIDFGADSYFNPSTSGANIMASIMPEENQSLGNCYSSFLGNNLPFDIQKGLFSEASGDVVLPSNPEPMLDDPGGPFQSGLSASEGKPIEVISSRAKKDEGFNISEFIKSLIPGSVPSLAGLLPSSVSPPLAKQSAYSASSESHYEYPTATPPPPMPPPPLPPMLFGLDIDENLYKYGPLGEEDDDAWNTKLPPKFPTWGDTRASWEGDDDKPSEWMPVLPLSKAPLLELDTPESPPMFEKEGFSDPVEYDDSVVVPSTDVDHRTLVPLPQTDTDHRTLIRPPNHTSKDVDHRSLGIRKKDVDHRNLISLTGSPVQDRSSPVIPSWMPSDQDYRTLPTAAKVTAIDKDSKDVVDREEVDREEVDRDEADQDEADRDVVDQDVVDQDYRPTKQPRDETQDNVESVDMEMSDEESVEPSKAETPPPAADQSTKSSISFNINSQSKLLSNSPLGEAKEEANNRHKAFGSQRIPTIGSNILMSPRPRVALLPTPMRSLRPGPPSIFPNRIPPPPQPPPPIVIAIPAADMVPLMPVTKPEPEPVLVPAKVELVEQNRTQADNGLMNNQEVNQENVVVKLNISGQVEPPVKPVAPPREEPWMNDDIPDFDQQELERLKHQRNFRARGFFPQGRASFNPRNRPVWIGPRPRGPPPPLIPPPCFPFRPPGLDEGYVRGQRPVYRPYRNPRHFGGW